MPDAVAAILNKHYAGQRLLHSCRVVVPFAPELVEHFAHERTDARRGFGHLLATIQALTFLYQVQRVDEPADGVTILATEHDYRIARSVLDVAGERVAAQAHVPIAEHVAAFMDFVRSRKAGGHAPRYLRQVASRVNTLIRFANIAFLPDLDADRTAAYVASMQARAASGFTVNEHVGTLKQFTKWAAMTGRLMKDPLSALRKSDGGKLEKKHPHRADSPDELGRLLTATLERPALELRMVRTGANKGKLVANVREAALDRAEALGCERWLAYLLLLWTGLNRGEQTIAQLAPLPTAPTEPAESMRITGTCDRAPDSRAAHAQRAAHSGVRTGASECIKGGVGVERGDESQKPIETAACAAVQGDSRKRVIGLEPTTFTLAT